VAVPDSRRATSATRASPVTGVRMVSGASPAVFVTV